MNSRSERILTELLIARALVKLSSVPAESLPAMVTLASIGNCEVRMFLREQPDLDGVPLFWLELFDRGTEMSIDSFRSLTIKEAVPVFEDLMSQADFLSSPDADGAEAQ